MFKQVQYPTFEDAPQPRKVSGLSFTAIIAIFCVFVIAGIFIWKMNQDDDDNIVGPITIMPMVTEALII